MNDEDIKEKFRGHKNCRNFSMYVHTLSQITILKMEK